MLKIIKLILCLPASITNFIGRLVERIENEKDNNNV